MSTNKMGNLQTMIVEKRQENPHFVFQSLLVGGKLSLILFFLLMGLVYSYKFDPGNDSVTNQYYKTFLDDPSTRTRVIYDMLVSALLVILASTFVICWRASWTGGGVWKELSSRWSLLLLLGIVVATFNLALEWSGVNRFLNRTERYDLDSNNEYNVIDGISGDLLTSKIDGTPNANGSTGSGTRSSLYYNYITCPTNPERVPRCFEIGTTGVSGASGITGGTGATGLIFVAGSTGANPCDGQFSVNCTVDYKTPATRLQLMKEDEDSIGFYGLNGMYNLVLGVVGGIGILVFVLMAVTAYNGSKTPTADQTEKVNSINGNNGYNKKQKAVLLFMIELAIICIINAAIPFCSASIRKEGIKDTTGILVVFYIAVTVFLQISLQFNGMLNFTSRSKDINK